MIVAAGTCAGALTRAPGSPSPGERVALPIAAHLPRMTQTGRLRGALVRRAARSKCGL